MMDKLAIEPEYGRLLREMVIQAKPESVVEIGTGHGFSTSFLLEGVRENKKGTVYTYDSVDRETTLKNDRLKRFLCEFSNSKPFLPKEIDFVFHDAGHWFEHVGADLGLVFPMLTPNAVIAVHDIIHSFAMGEKLKQWFDSMEGWSYEEKKDGCGLGIARRVS